ncbi:hypothetical protein ACFOEE_13280 [Pseudoalteromonas fenneropenaei]|uniref:Peptidase M61 catalytic domain-containing protein n=1 Tax=Pseudoalteromonas fenneropenaei TaxID=1737459 RepID=A0ABV7CLE9_9GAMM
MLQRKLSPYVKLKFALLLFSTSALSQEVCNATFDINIKENNNRISVLYKTRDNVELIKLAAYYSASRAFDGEGSEVKRTDDGHIAIDNSSETGSKLSLKPLNSTFNATYAPYVNLGKKHGLHLYSITPIQVKFKHQAHWSSVASNCIHYFAEDALHGYKYKVDDSNAFVVLDFNAKGVVEKSINKFNFIFNEATPKWIEGLVRRNFPLLFYFYKKNLKSGGNYRFNILVSFERSEYPFYDGGVHDNSTFLFRFGGEQYLDYDESLANEILDFIAHEVFHSWTTNHSSQAAWLKEGAADYAANIARFRLKMIDESVFLIRNNQQKLSCLLGYSHRVIPNQFDWQGRYSCGHAFLSNLIGDANFFRYWRSQLKNSGSSDADYFINYISIKNRNAVKLLTGDAAELVPEQIADGFNNLIGEVFVNEMMSSEVIRTTVFEHLMLSACNGQISFETRHQQVRMYYQDSCLPDFKNATGYIQKLNGIDIRNSGYQLLESYFSSCETKKFILVEGDGFSAQLPCKIAPHIVGSVHFKKVQANNLTGQ